MAQDNYDKQKLMKLKRKKVHSTAQPFAKHQGELTLGSATVDCYVLSNGDRVITQRGAVKAIANRNSGNLGEYLGAKAIKANINKELVLGESLVEFSIPGTQFTGKGITSDGFIEICSAYVRALEQGMLKDPRQQKIAFHCAALMTSFAKVGLDALIDEATGYQREREDDALQIKLAAYLCNELRPWSKLFPDQLWEQFGRLTNWRGALHSRPKWWGKLVNELVYQTLDSDVADYLRTHMPPPQHGKNYHQYFNEDFGVKKLREHILIILGMAKACRSIKELRSRVANEFQGRILQEYLF